jgi:hypothetical protein
VRQFVEEDYYLLGKAGREVVAAMPTFLKRGKYGNVLNSLPFWGSNGGVIVNPTLPPNEKKLLKRTLLQSFYDLANQLSCVLSTIIVSPLEEDPVFYEECTRAHYTDERIGQVTLLPESPEPEDLLGQFESVRRRNIRKAMKSGVTCHDDNTAEAMEFLYELHVENMSELGGLTKPREFFQVVRKVLKYGTDYRLYIAEKDDVPIAGLLLFYHNRTVEYYVPAVLRAYRTIQPLSLLVFASMLDAIREGYNCWNWGGTWHSQTGVYDFKKRWGAKDIPYGYYTTAYRDVSHIKSLSKPEILREYPYFYVMPFSKLEVPS